MSELGYLIYILVWRIFILGGTGYVVFELHNSGWWFLLAIMISGITYTPESWAALRRK